MSAITSPIPGKNPVHFQAARKWMARATLSAPVQACAPVGRWGSCFPLLARSARLFSMLVEAVCLESESRCPPSRPVKPRYPAKSLYIFSPDRKEA